VGLHLTVDQGTQVVRGGSIPSLSIRPLGEHCVIGNMAVSKTADGGSIPPAPVWECVEASPKGMAAAC
jgi:hypothetical protein